MRRIILSVLLLVPLVTHALEPGKFEPLPLFTWGARVGFNATGTYIDKAVFDRAIDYCRNGNVAYLSISGGIGTAFVKGTEWYEVNFRYDDGLLVEMYCECPYPGLCKHLLAVAITLEALTKNGLNMEKDFVMVDDAYFWRFVSKGVKKITL